VAENKGENSKSDFDLQVPKSSARDEVESAKILFQEGLLDEAKKTLHRILISHPAYSRASKLLKEIQKTELNHILNRSQASSDRRKMEDPERILRKLEADLGISIESRSAVLDPAHENWTHSMELSSQERFDLGIAFFEMGCFRDADRELAEALRIFRVENSSLDESGVSIVALRAESLIRLEEAFEAKMFLAPILNEPEISHELKLPLYYLAARSEELLGARVEAKAWLQKVMDIDPLFRDANFRIRLL
jgi:tetratricopeptide (TPR) repeat protein